MSTDYMAGLFASSLAGDRDAEGALTASPVITNISIKRLFGRYSYSIPTHDTSGEPGGHRRLMLLYGDNGSGKTTILRLVYHLLSSAARRGHRSFIARTPFEELSVSFANTMKISVSRPEDKLKGSFMVTITEAGVSIEHISFIADEELKIPSEVPPEQEAKHLELSRQLERLNLRPYYLADDRSITSDLLGDDDERLGPLDRDRELFYGSYVKYARLGREELLPKEIRQGRELISAIRRAEEWLRQQTFRGTNTGSANANGLYLDVMRSLTTSTKVSQREPAITADKSIEQRLIELAQRTAAYAEFGLSTALPAGQFLETLSQAPPDRRPLLENVLVPYLDGIQAQLDALKDVQELLVTFTSAVNSFLSDKALRFTLRDGISISTSDNDELSPMALSSGERQLVLLLCSVLVARDDTHLFIIDEPEISLNVKWQRQLLDALLDCTAGTDMQFLVATHSIEMIAGHRESVARLVDERE